jgi:nucleotide-binding universal stress UspA family protein
MRDRSSPGSRRPAVIVVGIDDSASSISALHWAAELLGSDGALHAVRAVSPSLELAAAAVQSKAPELVARAGQELERATAAIRRGGRPVEHHVVEDQPESALRTVAAEVAADMIAVGVHRQAAHVPRRIGRTVSGLIDRAQHPLAVIPEGSLPSQPGTVVVAVGGGAELRPALRWAVDYAIEHGCALSLVRAADSPPMFSMDWMLTRMAHFIDPAVLGTWALDDLAELADQVQRSTDEELEISLAAAGRRAGPTLVEAGSHAALLVLEARPRPESPVPSWVHHAVRHTPCPAVLFPAGFEPARRAGG